MNKTMMAAALLTLAGCVSLDSSIPLPAELYEAANQAYANRPVDALVMRYGLPSGRTTVEGRDALAWEVSTTMQFRGDDRTTTVNGRIGDASRWPFTDLPYSARFSEPTYATDSFRCTMLATVDSRGTVLGLNFIGKMGACKEFWP